MSAAESSDSYSVFLVQRIFFLQNMSQLPKRTNDYLEQYE